ncbi:helix-turn-helix domain-containing protein [Companilactobacillus allii]|uniref:HTH cro/C1-type domain-containing protein n=1 Tax=Companilactobacillus allii TaxID=1847728 RepID=A0A1P8Q4B2_9LACO|nr:helix-turn-helix domain-containing protein [Companilactobacillus allii]APX72686.1 hypothetical protein BTM29_09045 [Companilactobacillus allii]USQ69792.1 helix-turn-helix domain-containing protein [Companilactobacillus allii]
MTVYDNIKKYSKIRGMSLQQVAEKSGLSKNMIYQYRTGKNPSLETLDKIANVLKVDRKDLLDDDSKKVISTTKEIDVKEAIDNDDVIMTFEGRPIPPEDLELMKRLLRGGRNDQ